MCPPKSLATALCSGPHRYPTGDMEPLPEEEEEEELLLEPTDFGRLPVSLS